MMNVRSIADGLIEAPIVTSFTRLGFAARQRLANWSSLDDYDLTDRVIVITGATSGLGAAAAHQLAHCGATLVVVGRSAARNERAVADLVDATGNCRRSTHSSARAPAAALGACMIWSAPTLQHGPMRPGDQPLPVTN